MQKFTSCSVKNLKSNPAAGRTWDHLRLAQGSDRSGTSFPDYSLLLARSVRRTIPAQIDKTKRQWVKGIEIGLKPLISEANCNNHRLGKAHLDHLLENTGNHVGGIWSFSVCLFWFVQLNKWDVSVSIAASWYSCLRWSKSIQSANSSLTLSLADKKITAGAAVKKCQGMNSVSIGVIIYNNGHVMGDDGMHYQLYLYIYIYTYQIHLHNYIHSHSTIRTNKHDVWVRLKMRKTWENMGKPPNGNLEILTLTSDTPTYCGP